jgi:peptidoglycan glycosyltransferase
MRRGSILDRNGEPLAVSPASGDGGKARSYPLGSAFGTLMGVSPSERLLPPWALERLHDTRLRGFQLTSFVPFLDLDGAARDKALADRDADIASRSVTLSIDARLQAQAAKLAQAVVARGKVAAAAVVIDVDTGQVLARVQAPDYDPGKPAAMTFGAYGTWPDKTGVQGMFQSGSVGKLFTAFAAQRTGKGGERYECRDSDAQGPLFTVKGWPKPIHDHSGDSPHGDPDLALAIAVSCNVYFAQLGLALGPEPLRALQAAGLEAGYGGALDPGEAGSRQLASTAFGQGVMVMNVMQAARMVAAIAAGGVYRKCPPTMELAATCETRSLIGDANALQPIVDGMRRVMTSGTGARLSPPAGVRVYGKTGTADVRGFAGEENWGIARAQTAAPHSWFVAFAEADTTPAGAASAPGRLAIAVVVPRGGTGASAAGPLAMQILGAARELGFLR